MGLCPGMLDFDALICKYIAFNYNDNINLLKSCYSYNGSVNPCCPFPLPPGILTLFFFGTAAIAQRWVSWLSQKNSLWGLKKCANASPWDNTKKAPWLP